MKKAELDALGLTKEQYEAYFGELPEIEDDVVEEFDGTSFQILSADYDGNIDYSVLSDEVVVYNDSKPEEILPRCEGAEVIVTKELVLTPEQKEGLLSRINRRIIVNKNQLQGATVHFDKNEATAMDNTGKIYIIDKAIQNEQIIEMTMDINALPQTGLPINLDKKNNTVTIKQKNGNEMTLPISAAVKVKKLPAEIQF